MIKTLSLLTRKAGTSHEAFVHWWVHEHAPLAHGVPGLRRYVLSHIVGQPTRPDVPSHEIDVDGIAELWYDDADAMHAAAASPQMRALREHGATLIGRIKNYVIHEEQVVPVPERGVPA